MEEEEADNECSDELVDSIITNRYSVHSIIGGGATSQIYLATDQHSHQTVVLKRVPISGMRQAEVDQAMTEVRARLAHRGSSEALSGVGAAYTASTPKPNQIPRKLRPRGRAPHSNGMGTRRRSLWDA